jgi:hypothetical protein
MANIREAPPQDLTIQPTERGADAFQQAARRTGAFYSQAADDFTGMGQRLGSAVKAAGDVAVKQIEHHEISTGSANFAKMQAELTQQWNETAKNADPNDPGVAAKFREKVLEPALEKFGDQGFLTEGGQKWALGHTASLRQHMFDKTSADMSTLAGEAVKINARKTENYLASTARMDPSSLDFQLSTAESSLAGIVDSSPTLRAADASRVKQEVVQKTKEAIVRAAGLGIIEKNPNFDLAAFEKKYGEYMPPGEMQQLVKAAKSQARADLYYQKGAESYQHQQDVRNADAQFSKTWTNNVTFDENGKPTINPQLFKDVMETEKRYPGAATERAKAIINWSQSQQKEKRETIVTDKKVQADLLAGMSRTERPTTDVDILNAAANEKLDPHATSVLLQLHKAIEETPLKGPIYHDTLQAVKGITGDSPQGHERFAKFVQTFVPEYIRQKKAGTLPPDALDLRDENSLISKALKPYRPDAKQQMEERIMKNLGVGSSLEDATSFLKGEKVINIDVKDKPITLPPLDKRDVNTVYPTPRGPMRWTGNDWVKP